MVGVSNGALQFMAYERIKTLAFKQKRKSFEKAGKPWTTEDDKLVGSRAPGCNVSSTDLLSLSPSKSNITYIMASGASKIFALAISYPYQVVRARIQVRISYRPPQTPEPDDTPRYRHHTHPEQRHGALISEHPHLHHQNILRIRPQGVLPWPRDQPRQSSTRNLRYFRGI